MLRGALGFGVIVGSHWCYGKWPPHWERKNIAILELHPIVLSLHLYVISVSYFVRTMSLLYTSSKNSLVRITQCLLGNFSPFVYITVLFSKLSIFQVFATSSLMLRLACRCTLLNSWPQLIWTPSPQRFPRASELSNIVTMLASSSLYSLPRF